MIFYLILVAIIGFIPIFCLSGIVWLITKKNFWKTFFTSYLVLLVFAAFVLMLFG